MNDNKKLRMAKTIVFLNPPTGNHHHKNLLTKLMPLIRGCFKSHLVGNKTF